MVKLVWSSLFPCVVWLDTQRKFLSMTVVVVSWTIPRPILSSDSRRNWWSSPWCSCSSSDAGNGNDLLNHVYWEERGTIFVNPGTEVYEGEWSLGKTLVETTWLSTLIRQNRNDQRPFLLRTNGCYKTPRIWHLEESLSSWTTMKYMEVTLSLSVCINKSWIRQSVKKHNKKKIWHAE